MWQKALFVIALILLVPASAFAQNSNSKHLSYQNNQYGFSIQYPSSWIKIEQLSKDSTFPNMIDIVTFHSPTKSTQYGIMLIKDDTTYQGLSGQKFLDKMKSEFGGTICSSAIASGATCTMKSLAESNITHQNGYAGYMMGLAFTISSDKGQSHPTMFLGVYPDGNDIWVLTLLAFSQDEFNQFSDDLTTTGGSFMINNYHGVKTIQTQAQKTTAESNFGVLKINSGVFSASKYSSNTMTVSGGVTIIQRGTPITLQIIKPDNTIETEGILVNKDGGFSVPVIVNGNWPSGNYAITATYGGNVIGTVYFQVISENAKTTAQTTKLLLYENNQYGFSIKYPSDLKKEEKLEKDQVFPNAMDIVDFTTPSELSTITVTLIKDDTIFTGLNDQKFLDKMKNEFKTRVCSAITDPAVTCSMEVLDEQSATNQNGYNGYYGVYAFTISNNQNSQKVVMFTTMYPDGNNVWALISGILPGEDYKDIGKETGKMYDSFIIYDYKVIQQFSLHSKASQENDIVYLTIKNPKESSDDIYGIKLTNINGKITNFIKIKGWDYMRVGTDSVIYQTTSSPLNPSDLIKIALKVDSKNTEIKWEAFSKDKTSLGTGSVKP